MEWSRGVLPNYRCSSLHLFDSDLRGPPHTTVSASALIDGAKLQNAWNREAVFRPAPGCDYSPVCQSSRLVRQLRPYAGRDWLLKIAGRPRQVEWLWDQPAQRCRSMDSQLRFRQGQ